MKVYCLDDTDNGFYDISFSVDNIANLLDNAVTGLMTLVSYKYMSDDDTPVEVSVVDSPAVVKVVLYLPESSGSCLIVTLSTEGGDTIVCGVVNVNGNSVPLPKDVFSLPLFTGLYEYYNTSGTLVHTDKYIDEKITMPTETASGTAVIRDGSRVVMVIPVTVTP